MRFIYFSLAIALVAAGCKREQQPVAEVSESVVVPSGERTYADLALTNAVLRVGDHILTKGAVEDEVNLKGKLRKIKLSNLSPIDIRRHLKRDRKTAYNGFATKCLLLDRAKELGMKASEEELKASQRLFTRTFGGNHAATYAALKGKLKPDEAAHLDRLVAEDALIKTVIADYTKGKTEVTEAEIDELIDQVKKLNEAAEKAMTESREKAEMIRDKLLKGENFHELADLYSMTKDEDGKAGIWDKFVVEEIPYPEMIPAVEPLKQWEWAGPLELDDGIHFVRVTTRRYSGSEPSRQDEVELARIVIPLPMFYEAGTREEIRRDTAKMKSDELQQELLKTLREKVVIDYPSGTNLWPEVTLDQAKKQFVEKMKKEMKK